MLKKAGIEHFFHLAAIYDMTRRRGVQPACQRRRHAPRGGAREAIDAGCLHHTSSIAVAGIYKGVYREDMFDEGQKLDHPYHRTKFEAERIVRTQTAVPWRVYRPSIVVGNSKTGEMDKIDGPYYFFTLIKMARHYLPAWFPLIGPELGYTNVVPVDFVAAAMDEIAHQPGLDGRAFHLTNPKSQRSGELINIIAKAAHAPQLSIRVDTRLLGALPKGAFSMLMALPPARIVRRGLLADVGIPEEVLGYVGLTARFDTRDTERALEGSGISVPPIETYADKLWDYWERNLDPDLFKDRSFEGAVNGKTVLITGASSGIGKAAALKIARAGGIVILVARGVEKLEEARAEIEDAGGIAYAYRADLSELDSIDALVRIAYWPSTTPSTSSSTMPAARSAARSRSPTTASTTSSGRSRLNYLGAIKLIMGFLPQMRERRAGHVINVSSIGVQDEPPAVLGLCGIEVGARCVDEGGRLGVHQRQRPLHDDPHAARAHADDRSHEDVRQLPDDLLRRGGRHDLRGDPHEAEADQHPAGHVRRGLLRAVPQSGRSDPLDRIQGVPRFRRRTRRDGPERACLDRAGGARESDEGRSLVSVSI